MPRFEDGAINLQELIRRLAEDVANGIMDAEADQMCETTGNGRNGYRPRTLRDSVANYSPFSQIFLIIPVSIRSSLRHASNTSPAGSAHM